MVCYLFILNKFDTEFSPAEISFGRFHDKISDTKLIIALYCFTVAAITNP